MSPLPRISGSVGSFRYFLSSLAARHTLVSSIISVPAESETSAGFLHRNKTSHDLGTGMPPVEFLRGESVGLFGSAISSM